MALKNGAHVVSYDWLEDSLQRGRKLAERKYTWAAIQKQRKQKKRFERIGKDFDSEYILPSMSHLSPATST
jgi:hypothetical protein